uniref:Uncharacterized protein n=1 Tax=Arundo donax TaxID=35708 RepID=A0A0A9BFG4_ARUDO
MSKDIILIGNRRVQKLVYLQTILFYNV